MVAKILFTPESYDDIDEAFGWYERKKTGLGDAFFKELHENVQAIRKSPKMHAPIFGVVRRRLLRHFPYAIFYEYDAPTVIVYCVFHTSRNPKIWKDRLL